MNPMVLLWAGLILLGLGAILAIVIFVATKFLYVKEDERIAEVVKMLPNANCGACGHPGCQGFAEALVSGKETKVSKCRVGKDATTYDPIIRYLEAHPNPNGSKVIVTK